MVNNFKTCQFYAFCLFFIVLKFRIFIFIVLKFRIFIFIVSKLLFFYNYEILYIKKSVFNKNE